MPRKSHYTKKIKDDQNDKSIKVDVNAFAVLYSGSESDSESDNDNNSNNESEGDNENKSNESKTKYVVKNDTNYESKKEKSDDKYTPNKEKFGDKYTPNKEKFGDRYVTKNDNYDKQNDDSGSYKYVAPSLSVGWQVPGRKKKYKPREAKPIFEGDISEEDKVKTGEDKQLNSKWNVSLHNVDKNWDLESYDDIFNFDTIGGFWKFFNNFHLLDKIKNHVFIMRDGITPIWEDVNNRNGGICSFKIDYLSKGGRNDIGSEIMMSLCILLITETFVRENICINGISYAIKNKSIMIKLWIKNFDDNIHFQNRLPVNFFNKLDFILRNCDVNHGYSFNDTSKVNVKYSKIEPQF